MSFVLSSGAFTLERALSSHGDDWRELEMSQVVLASLVASQPATGAASAGADRKAVQSAPALVMRLAQLVSLLAWKARGPRPVTASQRLSADASFAEGWAHLQREQFAEAERSFHLVLAHRPEEADASLYLGMALAGQGRHAEAIAPLRDAAAARPLDAEIHARLGISLRETGQPFLAMTSLREALRLRPGVRGVEAALDDTVSAACSGSRTSLVRARSPRRGARRRSHRYTRRTMPASSRELRVGA